VCVRPLISPLCPPQWAIVVETAAVPPKAAVHPVMPDSKVAFVTTFVPVAGHMVLHTAASTAAASGAASTSAASTAASAAALSATVTSSAASAAALSATVTSAAASLPLSGAAPSTVASAPASLAVLVELVLDVVLVVLFDVLDVEPVVLDVEPDVLDVEPDVLEVEPLLLELEVDEVGEPVDDDVGTVWLLSSPPQPTIAPPATTAVPAIHTMLVNADRLKVLMRKFPLRLRPPLDSPNRGISCSGPLPHLHYGTSILQR
jgi:hypothetical protein